MLYGDRRIAHDRWAARPAGPWIAARRPVEGRRFARAAILTFALSLPQGVLVLPIAVAQAGVAPGLLLVLGVGALNTLTAMWTARATAAHFAEHGAVPSLTQLASARIGPWGGLLAFAGGVALFFLALLASTVGLARSLADLSGAPAPMWGAASAALILLLALRGAALSMRLLAGLGLLNAGLVVAMIFLALPHAAPALAQEAPADSTPLPAVGVSMMLFFAPMLIAPVAQQVLPHTSDHRAFARGSAAGVAGSAALFGAWAAVVCGAAGPAALAGLSGTAIPVLREAVPAARLPGALLVLGLLGMTALRCALVLCALADEALPARLQGRRRRLTALAPAALGLALALVFLIDGATSLTHLVAVAGAGAASITSLVVPALLERAAGPGAGARPGRPRS